MHHNIIRWRAPVRFLLYIYIYIYTRHEYLNYGELNANGRLSALYAVDAFIRGPQLSTSTAAATSSWNSVFSFYNLQRHLPSNKIAEYQENLIIIIYYIISIFKSSNPSRCRACHVTSLKMFDYKNRWYLMYIIIHAAYYNHHIDGYCLQYVFKRLL